MGEYVSTQTLIRGRSVCCDNDFSLSKFSTARTHVAVQRYMYMPSKGIKMSILSGNNIISAVTYIHVVRSDIDIAQLYMNHQIFVGPNLTSHSAPDEQAYYQLSTSLFVG